MRLSILFLLLFLLPASAAGATERVYGQPAEAAAWPNLVAFSDDETDLLTRCAGVLIRPQWVLTAPNGCMGDRRDDSWAYIGASKSSPYDGVKVKTEQVYLHPKYSSEQPWWSLLPTWNIALVKLERPVFGRPEVALSSKRPEIGSKIKVAGLGNNTADGKEFSSELFQSEVSVVNKNVCRFYLDGYGTTNRSFFCAFTPREGPCMLDEGAGAFQDGKLVGLFNLLWGPVDNPVCPRDEGAGIYTAIAPALSWIQTVLEKGYDKGRFLDFGAYIFPDKELNLYSWTTQEIYQPQMRISGKTCIIGKKRCFAPNQWITLTDNTAPGATTSSYWMQNFGIRLEKGPKRCFTGQVRARFIYPSGAKKTVRDFKSCVRKDA